MKLNELYAAMGTNLSKIEQHALLIIQQTPNIPVNVEDTEFVGNYDLIAAKDNLINMHLVRIRNSHLEVTSLGIQMLIQHGLITNDMVPTDKGRKLTSSSGAAQ